MILSNLIPAIIRQKILCILAKRKYDVKIGNNCYIDRTTVFEGYNAIFNNNKISNSFIGRGTYIANNSIIRSAKIGRYCSIGDYVRTGLGLHPTKEFVSTSPAFFSPTKYSGLTFVEKLKFAEHKFVDEESKYYCQIGNDVWIGNNVMIMDGVNIGNGAVIAAGAIVIKDVEPYSIVGGLPAKEIKKRFNEEQIKKLQELKWWDWDVDTLKLNADLFENIEDFLQKMKNK